MSNIGDMLVDVKGLKSVHDSIKNTFSTKQELTNVDSKFSEVNSARQSGNGTTYNNLKARLDADKEAIETDIGELKADLGDLNDVVFYDSTIALVNKNSGTGNVNDINLGITLEAGKEYAISINSTMSFASDTNVYFRNTKNLNMVGVIPSGATTATFTAAPTEDATAVRINASMSGAIFTIEVKEPQSKLVLIDDELEKIEDVLFTRKTVASATANGGSGTSTTTSLGVALTAGQDYIVTVASTVAFSENSVVRFYESANLNAIGTILAGEYGGTFKATPSANCGSIRIQGTSSQSVYTITVEQDSDAITDMQDAYVDIFGDYTNDFSVDIPMRLEPYLNMLLTSYAYYEGSEAPIIRVSRQWNAADNSIIRWNSPKYIIGGKNSWKLQTWRIPPYMDGMPHYTHVEITVPTGTTLHIKQLKNTYCDDIDRPFSGVRFYAHGLCGFGAPNNTSLAFEMSAKLGYSYCIAIPKVTSDGVLVCLHDDTSIQATARNDDGTEIASQYQNVPINEFTYEQLLQFDFGIFRGLPFAGLRIPTIEEFFRICAMTGMHPMFSVHVFSPLNDKWEEIKLLAKKYGVLHHLGIKADRNTISIPMAVLGDEVESYNLFSSAPASELITQFNTLKETYGISKARCTIEYAYAYLTQEYATAVINAGFELACNTFYTSITTTYTDMIDNLIKMGVTEFVEDYNCSSGLNW